MASKFKVAGVQMDIAIADAAANLEKMRSKMKETRAAGAALTVFPECTTTGYCFSTIDEAREICQPMDGPSVVAVGEMCREFEMHCVFGFLESEASSDKIYNSLAMIDPAGKLVGSYRKIHLPFLGIDRFTTGGVQPKCVVETPLCNIGMNICYDSSFPEAARILALGGAQLICLPTNWPPTSGLAADVLPNTRAMENHVYFMSVNRIGEERGFSFIGKSKICDPRGVNLAFADHDQEEILYAEIDPDWAANKHLVCIAGEHEVHRMNDRRPDVYGPITDPQ